MAGGGPGPRPGSVLRVEREPLPFCWRASHVKTAPKPPDLGSQIKFDGRRRWPRVKRAKTRVGLNGGADNQ